MRVATLSCRVVRSSERQGVNARVTRYAVVHLVVQEALKDLIAPQVLDHMAVQAATAGANKPDRIIVAFLEPARHAIQSRIRERMHFYRKRAPGVRVALLPYTSHLRQSSNARLLGARLRILAAKRPIVFHCRTETAADWAVQFSKYLPPTGIVVDVRGAWPEELLFARGFDGPEQAPLELQEQFRVAEGRLRCAIDASDSVFTVSEGMVNYVRVLGADPNRVAYVPCCVRSTTFTAHARSAMRATLGLGNKLVFAYSGTVTRYQHVDDGLLAFFRLAVAHCPDAHLLCLTPDAAQMAASIADAGIADDRVKLLTVAQHEIPSFLAAADAGVLLRAPSRMNRFSEPTKFAEYLAAGLPVVVALGTGTLDTMVEAHGAGVAIDWFEADADRRRAVVEDTCKRLRARAEEMRGAALALCERRFLWSNYVTTVRAAYTRAIER